MGYRVERRVGRLVETAIWSPVSLGEAEFWGADHDAVVGGLEGAYVCFVDLRHAHVFPPEVVDAYVSTMAVERGLERTGTLLPNSAVVAMQISRMIKEAGHPGRRPFHDPEELAAFLAPVLEHEERLRLRQLLDAQGPG